MSAAPPPGFDPDKADNSEDVEKSWAVKSIQQMLTYWAILERTRGSTLRLTKYDSEIYDLFKSTFPSTDVRSLNEDEMKSPVGKEKWRELISKFEDRIEDFNFGTMLRREAGGEYEEEGTIFAVRMQFYAVEVVRNREGMNDWIYERGHPEEGKKEIKEGGDS